MQFLFSFCSASSTKRRFLSPNNCPVYIEREVKDVYDALQLHPVWSVQVFQKVHSAHATVMFAFHYVLISSKGHWSYHMCTCGSSCVIKGAYQDKPLCTFNQKVFTIPVCFKHIPQLQFHSVLQWYSEVSSIIHFIFLEDGMVYRLFIATTINFLF